MQQHSVADVMSPQMALQGPCTPSTPSIPGICSQAATSHLQMWVELPWLWMAWPHTLSCPIAAKTWPFQPQEGAPPDVCRKPCFGWGHHPTSANGHIHHSDSLGPMKNTQQRQLNMFDGTSLSGMIFILQAYSFRFSGS